MIPLRQKEELTTHTFTTASASIFMALLIGSESEGAVTLCIRERASSARADASICMAEIIGVELWQGGVVFLQKKRICKRTVC